MPISGYINLKIFSLTFIAFCFSGSIFSQSKIKGNREVKTEQVNVDVFHSLNIGNDLDVELIKSMSPSVTIEADSNLHPVINFAVTDSVLNFQVTKIVRRSKEFKVIIRYTDPLRFITLNGNVDVEVENAIQFNELELIMKDDAKIDAKIVAERFSLENNNNSTLKLTTNCVLQIESKSVELNLKQNSNNKIEINTEDLHVSTSDNAELDIEGFAYSQIVNATNATTVDAKKLLSNVSKVKLSEKADAKIQATDSISIDLSGSSKLELYGEPKIHLENLLNTSSILKKKL